MKNIKNKRNTLAEKGITKRNKEKKKHSHRKGIHKKI